MSRRIYLAPGTRRLLRRLGCDAATLMVTIARGANVDHTSDGGHRSSIARVRHESALTLALNSPTEKPIGSGHADRILTPHVYLLFVDARRRWLRRRRFRHPPAGRWPADHEDGWSLG